MEPATWGDWLSRARPECGIWWKRKMKALVIVIALLVVGDAVTSAYGLPVPGPAAGRAPTRSPGLSSLTMSRY